MQHGEDIDEIMKHLERGEALVIDDQWRAYITLEGDDTPDRFVVRKVLQRRPGDASGDWRRASPQGRYRSLAGALLSVEDYTFST